MLLCYLLSAVSLTLMLLIQKFLQPRFFFWQTHHQWKTILYALKSLSKNAGVISYSESVCNRRKVIKFCLLAGSLANR